MSTDFKVGLVGCGRISRNHFDAMRKIDGLTLGAVCDVVPERARAAGEQEGVPSYTNYDEMLRAADIQVVSVCTPSGLHAVQGAAAARAGKHVYTEKPIANTVEEALRIVDLQKQHGVTVTVGHSARLMAGIRQMKEAIEAGELGRVTFMEATSTKQ